MNTYFRWMTAVIFLLIGGFISAVMVESSLGDVEWFLRTGYVGFSVGVGFIILGVWTIKGGKYVLVPQILGSIGVILGSVLYAFILIGLAQEGTAEFVLGVVLFALLFIFTVGSTVYQLFS